MLEDEIVTILRRYNKGHIVDGYIDIKPLARKVKNALDEEYPHIIKFFLNETKKNKYGYRDISILALLELDAKKYNKDIYKIYLDIEDTLDDDWRRFFIKKLIVSKYEEAENIFLKYIDEMIKKDYLAAYFILALYASSFKEKGMPLFAEYLSKHILLNERIEEKYDFRYFLEKKIGYFVVNYFYHIEDNIEFSLKYLLKLYQLISLKVKKLQIYLKIF